MKQRRRCACTTPHQGTPTCGFSDICFCADFFLRASLTNHIQLIVSLATLLYEFSLLATLSNFKYVYRSTKCESPTYHESAIRSWSVDEIETLEQRELGRR
ncbi:hypothetical protein J6590_028608 [Homalodisca vitripennis]|nr:hypothetical protein J6590_028608 [Homalodisca vitripennis]